jgi:hypothetical protein
MKNKSIVVTSINQPTKALIEIASKLPEHDFNFIVIGDSRSPDDFKLENCVFYSLERQLKLDFKYAQACPIKHYARKNIGYLLSMQNGASVIIETDDDNIPNATFWEERKDKFVAPCLVNKGWVNAYKYFTDINIWPRGFLLDKIHTPIVPYEELPQQECYCPIQQGLADLNPDVDAIYRLVLPLPISFRQDREIIFSQGSWCPFNSQNTTWFSSAYPLLYLPYYCSFRMTDILRSFVAQRIAWENNWSILFHKSTVYQERNEHNLMKNFEDEVVGYLNNEKICNELMELSLKSGIENIPNNLISCYKKLRDIGVVGMEELKLLHFWLEDISQYV